MLTAFKRLTRSSVFIAGLFVSGLGLSVLSVPATAKTAPVQSPLMWKVTDADSTIYLLGSFHMVKAGSEWLAPRITSPFDASQEVWFEIADLDDQTAAGKAFAKYAVDPTKSLTKGMSPAEIARLETVLKHNGFTMEIAQNFKPWAVGLLISVRIMTQSGFNPELGADKVLQTRAKAQSKSIKGFETVEEQMAFFGSLTEQQGRDFLKETLDQADGGEALINTMMNAWLKGDADTLKATVVDEMRQKSPDLYQILLVNRNKAWAPKIAETLKGSGTTFIVVGVGHLIGPDSVQAQLKALGIKAEPVY